MRKTLFGAAAVGALSAFACFGAAQAQSPCVWTGFNWSCPSDYYYNPQYYGPYPYQSEGGSFPEVAGQKPPWLPSYPGPRPSTGAGH
jgi:hypothetical protein